MGSEASVLMRIKSNGAHAGGTDAEAGEENQGGAHSSPQDGKARTMNRGKYMMFAAVVILIGAMGVNVWAGEQARQVPPLEEVALATHGIVDATSHTRFRHLTEARDGFFPTRAWHWWRFRMLEPAGQ